MGAIVKFENKRGKTEIKPLTPIDFYTSDLYTTSNRINEIGNKLLLTMEQAATIAGLDFKKFAWIPEEPYSPIDDMIHIGYAQLDHEGTEYHISGAAGMDGEFHNMEVALRKTIPHELVYYFDFDKCSWKLHSNLSEQEKVREMIEKDQNSADILMEIYQYKDNFVQKDIIFYRHKYRKMIELYSKVSEFMEPVYNPDTEELTLGIFDPYRHGFIVVWDENEYRLEEYLETDDLMRDEDTIDFLRSCGNKLLRQVVWSGVDTDKLAEFLEEMGNRIVKTDIYTFPISIETYVEFKKWDLSDLTIHGNKKLTDYEKANLKRLKKGFLEMTENFNQN